MSKWTDLVLIHGNEEGARAAFERACESIIRAKHPQKKVRAVRVASGDCGIDIYVGELGVTPIDVYQCKYFFNGVNESQKSQIRSSHDTACGNDKFTVGNWFLCIPVDFSVSESKWFDGWAAKKTVPTTLVPAAELLKWAEELGLASTIFHRTDSLKLDEILVRLKEEKRDPWNALVEQTETDCYRILLALLRAHLKCLDGKYPHLDALGIGANAGDRLDACQYFKSAIAGTLSLTEKIWIFNILSDFTCEPIAYRFIRRYDELVKKAKELDRLNELSSSEFYTTWNIFRSPTIKHMRDAAEWKVNFL